MNQQGGNGKLDRSKPDSTAGIEAQISGLRRFFLSCFAPESAPGGMKTGDTGRTEEDRRCFVALCNAMNTPLVRLLYRCAIPAHAIPDLAQESLLLLWRKWDAARDNPEGYLFGMARNVALAYCRSQRRQAILDDQHREDIVQRLHRGGLDTPDPASQAIIEETRQRLCRLLARLPDGQREVLTRLYLDGHTAKEVAAQLGCSVDSIYVLRHKALTRLRELLSD